MRVSWPLTGRQEELDLLVQRLTGAEAPVVFIGGAAGVGKSRLAREAADRLAGAGWSIERVAATAASSTVPFGALARLLPPVSGDLAASLAAAEVIRTTVGALRARHRTQPLLLAVDDAHHLDPFSAVLLQQLATDGTVPQLLTIRSGMEVAEPLAALWKDGYAERVDLQPLGLPELSTLLGAVLGGAVERGSLEALWRATEGMPLLLHEVVADAVASGALEAGHGVWRWRPAERHGLRLREVVAARLGELSAEERRAVELVALGEPVGLAVLEATCPGVDLDALERRAVLRVEADGLRHDVRLWHPILTDVVRGQMPTTTRRARAAELVDALRALGRRRRGDRIRNAVLELEASEPSDPGELAEAAMAANALPDHPLAERLARAAHAAGPTFASALAWGEAAFVQGKLVDAERALREALALAPDDAMRSRIAWSLHAVCTELDRRAEGDAVLQQALDDTEDEAWRQIIRGHQLQSLEKQGRIAEAGEGGEQLLREAIDGRVRLRLSTSLVPARALAGRTADALELAASVVPDAFAHQDELPLGVTWAFVSRALALLVGGELRAAEMHVAAARAVSDGLVQNDNFSVLGLFEGRLALTCGRPTEAAAVLRETVGRLKARDVGEYLHWALALLAEAEALRGEQAAAEATAADAEQARRRPGTFDTDADRALAWVAAVRGERSSAVDALRAVADEQAARGLRALELQARHDAYRLGDRTQAPAILALTSSTDGTWSATLGAHVTARESGDAARLEEAARLFDEQGALLLAAETWAEAAEAASASGLKARATAALRRSADLRERCGPVHTPALADAALPARLTGREREVVELAARGLSNADIAARLFVSVRTVEGHLLRAFGKLGITDRAALREVLLAD